MAMIPIRDVLVASFCLFLIYVPTVIIYRLYFSPLTKFPGPRIAAATLWYEYYYDVVKRGRYTWKIIELHKQYGPIVRISPYELHINDPEFYDEIYVGPAIRRTEKYEWAVRGFGPTSYTFSTIPHELHRKRRNSVAPHFSKFNVQKLEPSVQAMVDKLVTRLEKLKGNGSVVNLIPAFASLTSDVICQYSFAAPYGYLDSAEFAPYWHTAVMQASEGFHFFKQFAWLETLLRSLPGSVSKAMAPQLTSLFLMIEMVREKIIVAEADISRGEKPENESSIIYKLLKDDSLSAEDKSIGRLENEFMALVAAGSLTVAHTLSITAYHIIANDKILHTLQDELKSVLTRQSGPIKWNTLEQLPYLTAVILEGLRWGNGVPHRLQRISPDLPIQYKEYTIPKGTPVGMTSVMMHSSPDHFPNPETFDPDRWLQPNASRLRKYLVAFSKGSRQCLGINLAYCELYLTLAAIFAPGRFRFEIYETDVSDVEVYHDFFNASQRVESKGIRVRLD